MSMWKMQENSRKAGRVYNPWKSSQQFQDKYFPQHRNRSTRSQQLFDVLQRPARVRWYMQLRTLLTRKMHRRTHKLKTQRSSLQIFSWFRKIHCLKFDKQKNKKSQHISKVFRSVNNIPRVPIITAGFLPYLTDICKIASNNSSHSWFWYLPVRYNTGDCIAK